MTVFSRVSYKYILTMLLILVGVAVHSRISALVCMSSLGVALVTIYCLGGAGECRNLEFYLYNAIPCGIALGGIFLVINRRTFFLALAGVSLVTTLTFLGTRFFPLPAFVAPFNLVTILLIWLIKSGRLAKVKWCGFYPVPMELVSTPELGIAWYRGEVYAKNYWRELGQALRGQILEKK